MKKILTLVCLTVGIAISANAQKVVTKAVDSKGTIKWVLDSLTAVITKADSTILYVTPKQLGDSLDNYVKYADTSNMLAAYVNGANNGLTKNGQTVQLGGALNQQTTISTDAIHFLAITGLQPTSGANDVIMVQDPGTGQIRYVSSSDLFNYLTVENGLTKTGNKIELGGDLKHSTTIGTDATNTLKIGGLQTGNLATDSLVVAGPGGTLKVVAAESLLQTGETSFVTGANQANYTVPGMPTTASKVSVYRNGIKLVVTEDYTVAGGIVTLSSDMVAVIVVNDKVEVQWVK